MSTMAGSIVGVNNQSYAVLLNNYQNALLNTLPERCTMLTQLLQDSPVKELQYIFPALIEHIFGFQSSIDWGLLSLEKDIQVKEFEAVKKFLAPNGPVLKLVFKFIEESSPKFEFPLSCLPSPSRHMLQERKVPTLYANKLQILNPGMLPSAVQLNAFEFYFFHFAYYIAGPAKYVKHSYNTVNQQDTLYAHLLEDYLCCFLPTDGRAVPLFQTPHNIQHSPILTSSLSSSIGSPHIFTPDTMFNRTPTRPEALTPMRQKPSLLKKGTIMMVTSPGSGSSCNFGSSQAECWKSETFLLILKEMYLNQNSSEHQQNILDLSMKTFVPTHYHVWMVRVLVKHLHFFFNSSLVSSNVSGHGQIMIDSLGRLKSLGMTQLIQKEMYCFLKSTFDHWPLDASFRVPLETWLSYIQPWRYTQCDLDLAVWQKFMTENVLFYTTVFQQVLKRFLRMDFNCPKNAYMLYRVTKVFSMPEMREMIEHAEKGCVSKPSSIGMSTYIHRSPEKSFSFSKASNLESPGTSYIFLFSEPVFLMVSHLLSIILTAQELAQSCGSDQNSNKQSFFSKIYNLFDTSDEAYNSDDNSPSDIKKVSFYLETSSKQLCKFFKEVTPPVLNKRHNIKAETSALSYLNKSEAKDSSGLRERIEQCRLLNEKKKNEIIYEGNPDLQPVRTYEIAALVSLLNEFSQRINEKYESEIKRLYYQPTILGKICRRIFAKPVVYHEVFKPKSMDYVSRKAVCLPPRVYLRFLANKHLISYFFIFILCAYWYGYNPILTVILLLSFIMLLIFLSAVIYPIPVEHKQE